MFIQIVQGACSRSDEMHSLVDDWCGQMSDRPGWLGGTYGVTDDGQFIGVVRFDSQDACNENCQRDDAGMWWAAAEALFDGSPTIHDSSDVTMMLDGGSDDAGFVQVIQGRVGDADKLRKVTSDQQLTSMLHEARPEIIGATLAISDDGTFTETVAFTSEDAARQGEQKEMPGEMGQDLAMAMSDTRYLDLHRPWFGSHR